MKFIKKGTNFLKKSHIFFKRGKRLSKQDKENHNTFNYFLKEAQGNITAEHQCVHINLGYMYKIMKCLLKFN